MTPRIEPEFRLLDLNDTPALEAFSCGGGHREPWGDVVEELIRENVAYELGMGRVWVLGRWSGSQLVGVAVWADADTDHTVWNLSVVAVQNGYQRRGHGRAMKAEVLRRAGEEGVRAIVSTVHADNEAMWKINTALGAQSTRLDRDHFRVVVPVPRRP